MSHIIAILWDFDKTLIRGYMQAPLFVRYGVDGVRFWDEANALAAYHAEDGAALTSPELLYLNHILSYVRAGVFAGLDNATLRALGAEQRLAPGVPEVFAQISALAQSEGTFRSAGIEIEHYVISTGLRQIILGSAVAPYVRHVWACEFLERQASPGFLHGASPQHRGVICEIGYVIDHTSKTRAIFEINKGVREGLGIDVNSLVPRPQRRVPFENMLYIADGPGDIPSLSVVRQFGGRTFGVYEPDSARDLAQAQQLLAQQRVDAIGPADYRSGGDTHAWLMATITEMAGRLSRSDRPATQRDPIPPVPRHIYD